MSGKIAGVSKRHFRRLVAKEKEKMMRSSPESVTNESTTKLESVYLVDHDVPNMKLVRESTSCSEDFESKSLEDDLSDWVVENGISLVACDRLLKILSSHGIRVAKNSKTLKYRENHMENTNLNGTVLEIKNMMTSMQTELKSINNNVENIQTRIIKHEVILGRISTHAFPSVKNFEIFPIDSFEQIDDIEEKIPKYDRSEIMAYIKRELGGKNRAKSFSRIFTKNLILEVNWDGTQGKNAIKNYALFNTYIYEALKSAELDFEQYTKEMKLALKLAKSRLYRDKYKGKLKTPLMDT